MKKPNLFIVGAARSGTTSLWQYLKVHPEVFMPEDEMYKEPAFFSNKGINIGWDYYRHIFKEVNENHKWVGEASTAYLTDPTSARRIYEYNPEAKIIIMLRNPADRAYSLYNWMVQDGYEYSESFADALKLEEKRVNKKISNWLEPQYYWNYLYFRSGLYYEQVKKYLDLFKENVLIIKFDDFKCSSNQEYQKICCFLEMNPNALRPEVHNESKRVYSAQIQFILRKVTNEVNSNIISFKNMNHEEKFNLILMSYNKNVEKLRLLSGNALSRSVKKRFIIKKIENLLKASEIDFGNLNTKEERDQLLKLGIRNKEIKKIKKKVREKLMKDYRSDLKNLSIFIKIEFDKCLE